MRKTFLTLTALFVLSASFVAAEDLNDDYYKAVGSYHRVSSDEVFAFADELGANHVAVAYVIAERSGVSIEKVVELRTSGQSWAEVAQDCKLSCVDFYILISGKFQSRTFSPIFETFRSTAASSWMDLVLSDEEIVNLVNLRFISSHHDYSMFDVMAMKDIGSDWPRINQKVASVKDAKNRKFAKR